MPFLQRPIRACRHARKDGILRGTVSVSVRMVIRGAVQGVGFRHFIFRRATELGLSGDVRNLPDGSVEVRARGDAIRIDELIALARRGPTSARVAGVEIAPGDAEALSPGFHIRP
jgi:acylphosphatase